MRERDEERIRELLELPFLLSRQRTELYSRAERCQIDVRARRFDSLLNQGCLFADDTKELLRLSEELDKPVSLIFGHLS